MTDMQETTDRDARILVKSLVVKGAVDALLGFVISCWFLGEREASLSFVRPVPLINSPQDTVAHMVASRLVWHRSIVIRAFEFYLGWARRPMVVLWPQEQSLLVIISVQQEVPSDRCGTGK